MRILNVITAYPPSPGGAQLHAHELNRSLRARGHHVEVATMWRTPRKDWLRGTTLSAPRAAGSSEVDGVRVHQIELRPSDRAVVSLAAAVYYGAMHAAARSLTSGYLASARAIVEAARPDVLHLSRIGREGLYEAFVVAAREQGVPYVLTPNHHPHWDRRRDWWWWRLYRGAGAVLVLSEVERRALVAGGVAPDRILRTVVGTVGSPPPGDGPNDGGVVFLGQVKSFKGLGVTFDAVRQLRASRPELGLDVVGPWFDHPTGLRERLDADRRTTVHDAVPDDRKWELLRAARVLCVPSTEEALGGVYLEAWQAGLASVGADIPPVRELFERTGGGIAVPPTVDDVAAAVGRLLDDEETRARCVAHGQRALREEYNWDVAADRALDAYHVASVERA